MDNISDKPKFALSRRRLLKIGAANIATAATASLLYNAVSAGSAFAKDSANVLIVYYSRSGNTRSLANIIHAQISGDLLELQTEPPYPDSYNRAVDEVRLELLTGKRRPLRPITLAVSSYDVIVLGSPRWWGMLSVPILNFLQDYDLSDKVIAPFNTHMGGDREKTFDDLKLLCPQSNILAELSLNGAAAVNAQRDVAAWLRRINLA